MEGHTEAQRGVEGGSCLEAELEQPDSCSSSSLVRVLRGAPLRKFPPPRRSPCRRPGEGVCEAGAQEPSGGRPRHVDPSWILPLGFLLLEEQEKREVWDRRGAGRCLGPQDRLGGAGRGGGQGRGGVHLEGRGHCLLRPGKAVGAPVPLLHEAGQPRLLVAHKGRRPVRGKPADLGGNQRARVT